MKFNSFNFRCRAARTALCLLQCVKYSYSLAGAMRFFTLTAAERTLFDAIREVFMKSSRRHAFHADRTVFDVMREVFMQSCRRYAFHVGRC